MHIRNFPLKNAFLCAVFNNNNKKMEAQSTLIFTTWTTSFGLKCFINQVYFMLTYTACPDKRFGTV